MTFKKFAASLLAAFTTPEAVKTEKSLLVIGLTRAAVLVPAAAMIIKVVIVALGG